MEQRHRALLVAGACLVSALGLFGLVVYPFTYDLVDSAVLIGFFLVTVVWRFVLDEGIVAD